MAWVKLDDCFPEHPKVAQAGDRAAWLYVCGLAYCSRHLTDGIVHSHKVGRLTSLPGERKLAERLVDVGLWRAHPEGYEVHDYKKHQRTREKVEHDRELSAQRMREWRATQEKAKRNAA